MTPLGWTEFQNLKPYESFEKPDFLKNLKEKVYRACKVVFDIFNYYISNIFIKCANGLNLYKFDKVYRKFDSFGITAFNVFDLTFYFMQKEAIRVIESSSKFVYRIMKLKLSYDKLNNLAIPIFNHSILKSFNKLAFWSYLVEPFYTWVKMCDYYPSYEGKNNKKLFVFSFGINLIRLSGRFYPLAICAASVETYLVAKKALQGLRECWNFSRIESKQSLKLAIAHITTLAVVGIKFYETIFNFSIISQKKDEENQRVKEMLKTAGRYSNFNGKYSF
jgi:hypothetical protein